MKFKKPSYKKKIMIVSIVTVLLVGLFLTAYWQRNNLQALFYVLNYSEHERQELISENETMMEHLLENFSEEEISLLSQEAVQMLQEGTLTEEEAVHIMTGKATLKEIKENKSQIKNEETNKNSYETNPNISNLVAKLYVLRAKYVGRLDALVAQGKAELSAGKVKKSELAKKYIGLGTSLEAECDAQIEGILAQIQAELQKSGGDTSLIPRIRAAYNQEKSIKKSSILSQYQ